MEMTERTNPKPTRAAPFALRLALAASFLRGVATKCYKCHTIVKATDYIFSRYPER